MAMTFGRVVAFARRARRAAVVTRLRTRTQRWTSLGRERARPVPDVDLGLSGVDTTDPGVSVLRDLHRSADPASTVWRLRERTRELAIVVTPATEWPGHEQRGLIEILPGDAAEPAAWSPSADGVRELLLAAGFTDVRVAVGPPAYRPRDWRPVHYTLVVHARP